MSEPDRVGVYPGTFDPITHGHLDIIQRATRMFDRLIIAVAANDGKNPQFGLGERVDMVKGEIEKLPNGMGKKVEVRSFDNLLVNFAQSVGAGVIVRGLRAVTDFEYEFQMAGMNAKLKPELETIFLMASERHQFISSRFVKEICRLGGDISQFVPPHIAERLIKSFQKK
ncbi:MAG TPA: pantetheine-phosphate adenylyltransferase [Alphaproteobacteria bacterium]|jgi:pantetheine-phosphate adenylyltransferase